MRLEWHDKEKAARPYWFLRRPVAAPFRLLVAFTFCCVFSACEEVEYRDGYGPGGPLITPDAQVDVSGTWLDVAGDNSTITITLVQSGNEVTGSFVTETGWTGSITGNVSGVSVSLTYTYSGGCVVCNSATVNNEGMTGIFWTPDRTHRGTWTATRLDDPHEQSSPERGAAEPQPVSTIWYSGVQDIYIGLWPPPPPLRSWWDLDFNSDGIIDYSFSFSMYNDLTMSCQGSNSIVGPLAAGTTIDADLPWSGGGHTMAIWMELLGGETGCAGPWCGVSNGYMDVKFSIGGNWHYGWIRISVSRPSAYGIFHDWAYETRPGVGIAAGATE